MKVFRVARRYVGMTTAIGNLIRTIRGQQVVLDFDLAALYGVRTFRFNQAFKRNRKRFPSDFAFQLTPIEFAEIKAVSASGDSSQVVMSRDQGIEHEHLNGDREAVRRKHRGAAYLPWAFTEHGALMAANILRSPRATEMSVFVIRAFVKMREELSANSIILRRLAEIDRTLLVHDGALQEVYQKLLPLLSPPDSPEKPKIGFHPGNR